MIISCTKFVQLSANFYCVYYVCLSRSFLYFTWEKFHSPPTGKRHDAMMDDMQSSNVVILLFQNHEKSIYEFGEFGQEVHVASTHHSKSSRIVWIVNRLTSKWVVIPPSTSQSLKLILMLKSSQIYTQRKTLLFLISWNKKKHISYALQVGVIIYSICSVLWLKNPSGAFHQKNLPRASWLFQQCRLGTFYKERSWYELTNSIWLKLQQFTK